MTDPIDPSDGSTDETSRRWPVLAAVALLVIITVGAIAFAVQQRSEVEEAQDRDTRQRAAELVASGFVEALISYDFEDLDAQQAAVERFVTDEFRADYAEAFTTEVRDQIVAEQARSTVTVEEVWITTDDGDEASAIVHARSMVESAAGATADLESYLRVRLVRLGDRWRVDDLTSLGSRDLSAPIPTPGTDTDPAEDDTGG